MKFLYSALLCLFLFSASAFSQTLTPYLAKDGMKITSDSAKGGGRTNVVLTGIGTTSGEFPSPLDTSQTISIAFNITSATDANRGKSTIWAYFYKAKTAQGTDTTLAYVVGQILIFKIAYPLPVGFIPDLPLTNDLPTYWMNSDSLVTRLYTDQTFKNYRKAFPDTLPQFVAVGKNAASPFGPDAATWIVQFGGGAGASMVCFVNASSQAHEVQCQMLSVGVEDDYKNKSMNSAMATFPNPANDGVILRVNPAVIRANATLSLYNSLGVKVLDLPSAPTVPDANEVYVPLESLGNGAYFLRYETAEQSYVQPLIIQR